MKMADWLLTSSDMKAVSRRRGEITPRRSLPQGQLIQRPINEKIRNTPISIDPYRGDSRVSDGTYAYKRINQSDAMGMFRFRGSPEPQSRAVYPSTKPRQSTLPSEKFGKKDKTGEAFRAYTSVSQRPRLFEKKHRKLRNYGHTNDRVKNIEEKNSYARLLALVNSDFAPPPAKRLRSSSGDFYIDVDKNSEHFNRSSSTQREDDSLFYMRTSFDKASNHHLRAWNRMRTSSSRHSTPNKARDYAPTPSFATGIFANTPSKYDASRDDLSKFVARLRGERGSKENFEYPDTPPKTSGKRPRPVPEIIDLTADNGPVLNQGKNGNIRELDDVIVLDSKVQVELEEIPMRRLESKRRSESPDVIIEDEATSAREVYERRMKSLPYVDKSWLQQQMQEHVQKAEMRARNSAEQEAIIRVYNESRRQKYDRLEEDVKRKLRIAELVPVVIEEPQPEEEDEEALYPELTSDMEETIDDALFGGAQSQVMVDHMRIQIRRSDLLTLEGTTWLNDEVINFYMNLIIQRGDQEGMPKVHAFNTFFYTKLIQQGHSSLKRWTRKIDVFAKDYLVVPVHLQMHWCMAIVDFREKEIRYYDSMGGKNNSCLKALRLYLEEESVDKKKKAYDTSEWKFVNAKGPQQMNGSDCGVFSTMCAEHVTRDAKLTYTQDLMPYFRRRMVYEIMTKKLIQ